MRFVIQRVTAVSYTHLQMPLWIQLLSMVSMIMRSSWYMTVSYTHLLVERLKRVLCNKTYYNKIPDIEVLTEREIEILRACLLYTSDVSDSRNLKGSGMTIAREISHRIKYELGVTAVSYTHLDVYKRQPEH